ncbi:minor capsid protein [Subtercola endophyticus]|uniref:minor capsid protein n=1 Tax=Subtercola endophyticus TaxID=2895559 RepID=UPI001E28AF13|nr:minor capsid protein [Subtercola endophyticus]UFS58930.1 minor capsid protein [Subtercola endophyticus]
MMLEWSIDMSGLDALDEQIASLTPIAVGRGMEHIRAVSAPLVPVQTGHLVGSASVTVEGDEAKIVYPGPYARYQHYKLGLRHTHGQPLFLEQPMFSESEAVMQIMAETLGTAF